MRQRHGPHASRWRWLILVPLICVVATLYVFISDGGKGYASSAFERLQQTAAELTSGALTISGAAGTGGPSDPFAALKPASIGLENDPDSEAQAAAFQGKVAAAERKRQQEAAGREMQPGSTQRAERDKPKQPLRKEEEDAAAAAPRQRSPPAEQQRQQQQQQQQLQQQSAGGGASSATAAFVVDPEALANYREAHRHHKVMVPGAPHVGGWTRGRPSGYSKQGRRGKD